MKLTRVIGLLSVVTLLFFPLGCERKNSFAMKDSELSSLENAAAYNTELARLIDQLTDVPISIYSIDKELEAVAYGDVPFEQSESYFRKTVDDAEKQLNGLAADLENFANANKIPSGLSESNEKLIRDSLAYAFELEAEARTSIALYKKQIEALKRGDLDEYETLVGDEVTGIIQSLYDENKLLEGVRDNQPQGAPEYFIREGMIQGNLALAVFLEYLNGYDDSSIEQDVKAVSAMFQNLEQYELAIDDAQTATVEYEAALLEELGEVTAKSAKYVSELQLAVAAEREILKYMKRYGALGEQVNNGTPIAEIVDDLDALDKNLTPAIERRVALTFSRQQSALELVQEQNESAAPN